MNEQELNFQQKKYEYDALQIIIAYLDALSEKDARKLVQILTQKFNIL